MAQANQTDNAKIDLPPIRICGHNRLIYWWPVWLLGLALATIDYICTDQYLFDSLKSDGASWHTVANLCYIGLILFVIFFTNVRTKPLTALVIVMTFILVFGAIYLVPKSIGYETTIFGRIPAFLVFMNANFLFVFSAGLFSIWFVVVVIIDPLHSVEISLGQIKHITLLKGHGNTLEEVGIQVSREDIPCHFILGLGLFGDIMVGKKDDQKVYENVFRVKQKVRHAEVIKKESVSSKGEGS